MEQNSSRGCTSNTLTVIEQSGLHLLELINEILDLAKIEAGHTDLNLRQINVSKLCHASINLVAPQAEAKQIQLKLEVPWISSDFVADEIRIRQVLVNLLGNAVKFTPEGGEVKLTVELNRPDNQSSETPMLRFIVTDNGIGIDQAKVDHLFEPFFQLDSSLSRNYEGTDFGTYFG